MRIVNLSLICLAYTGCGRGLDVEDNTAEENVPAGALASLLVGLNSGAFRPSSHLSVASPSVKGKGLKREGKRWSLSVPISLEGTKIKVPLKFIIKGVISPQLTIPLSFLLQKVVKLICRPTIDKCEVQLTDQLKFNPLKFNRTNATGLPMSASPALKGGGLKFPIKFSLMGYDITVPLSMPDVTSAMKVLDGRALSDFDVKDHYDMGVDLAKYKGKIVLIVDAKGLSVSDYTDLIRLQRKYGARGLQVLVLADKAKTLEEMYVYAKKVVFSGPRFLDKKASSALLDWLHEHEGSTAQKFLIGRNGKTNAGFGPAASMASVENAIKKKLRRIPLL
jgi:hypothetical protein